MMVAYNLLVAWLMGQIVSFICRTLGQEQIGRLARLATTVVMAVIAVSALAGLKAWWVGVGSTFDKWERILDKVPLLGR